MKDSSENQYPISVKQAVIILGWSYSSLCEVIRLLLSKIILFKKNPTGLGSLIYELKNIGIKNTQFFDDLDNKVRNAFFHINFEFQKDKIICTNKSKNSYIELKDLLWLQIHADRSAYVIMHLCEYVFKKS